MRFTSTRTQEQLEYDPQGGSWYILEEGCSFWWTISPTKAFHWLKEYYETDL